MKATLSSLETGEDANTIINNKSSILKNSSILALWNIYQNVILGTTIDLTTKCIKICL